MVDPGTRKEKHCEAVDDDVPMDMEDDDDDIDDDDDNESIMSGLLSTYSDSDLEGEIEDSDSDAIGDVYSNTYNNGIFDSDDDDVDMILYNSSSNNSHDSLSVDSDSNESPDQLLADEDKELAHVQDQLYDVIFQVNERHFKANAESKVVDLLDLECHFKWSKNIKQETHERIKNRALNAVEGLGLYTTRRELEREVFPAKYISLKCFEIMTLTFASENEKATKIIQNLKQNLSAIFTYKSKKYGHDLTGVYYLLDSMELSIKNFNEMNNDIGKLVTMFRTYDELSPRAKAFVLATKLEYFKLAFQPTEVMVNLAKQIVDLDPEMKEWQITYCKALRNHRLNVFTGPHMERSIYIPSQEELNCLKMIKFAEEYDPNERDLPPGSVLMRLTLCDILSDFLRSGSSISQLNIGENLLFNDRDEIIQKIVNEMGYFDYFYPNSIRIKLKVAEIFRQSYLRSSERNVAVYKDALDKLMDFFPPHPKFYKEKAAQVISNRLHNRETALSYLQTGMDLEPLNQHSVLSYLKFLIGFGNLINVDILNKKLELAESEGWSLDFKTTIIFFRGCLYWIENDKLGALQDWIYGYNMAQCSSVPPSNSNENGNRIKNSFLEKFWYLTKTQIKKNDWPAGNIGWKEVLDYLTTKPLVDQLKLNESELSVISEVKSELENIRDENTRQRQLQNYPDPPNLDTKNKSLEQPDLS